jgi:hypothetical protein
MRLWVVSTGTMPTGAEFLAGRPGRLSDLQRRILWLLVAVYWRRNVKPLFFDWIATGRGIRDAQGEPPNHFEIKAKWPCGARTFRRSNRADTHA